MTGTTNNLYDYSLGFNKRPVILMTPAQGIAILNGKKLEGSVLLEDNCTLSTNNSYRNHTSYEVMEKSTNKTTSKTYLDLGFLIGDETSCLKGSIDSDSDVDFYNFTVPFNRTIQNCFGVDINIETSKGSNCRVTLYDEYGNQVATTKVSGENKKTISIPNWDTQTLKYSIKIENEDGVAMEGENDYKISFHVPRIEDTTSTDPIHIAYEECKRAYTDKVQSNQSDYDEKNERYEKCLAQYNQLLEEAETYYEKQVENLHIEQYNALPEEKQYKGDKTVSQLLEQMASGEALNDAELEYVRIYANLSEVQKAQDKNSLKNELGPTLQNELRKSGISVEETKDMKIEIASDGSVKVSNIENEETASKVEQLIKEKYADQFYKYYIGIADSIRNLPRNTYEYITDVQEVDRFLKKGTNGKVGIEDLYMTQNVKIGGLPSNLDHYINENTNNAKAEELRGALNNVLGYQEIFGTESIPRFLASFKYEEGQLFVEDSGFSVDINELTSTIDRKNSDDSMYSRVYKYQFRKVI